ncbi:S8 family serine peptidase [Citrifermentans bremense]|uniref:S8 family serine peptidase n=1 Tax=Citrifermentans bremense TaxID=60035 RepID=UPI0012EC0902|nr:S8 family serine peptidase [Citrifermentans bremense]
MNSDWLDEDAVEIFGAKSDDAGRFLKYVYDIDSGLYLAPLPPPEEQSSLMHAAKYITKDVHTNPITAIFDTGMLYEHPLLEGTIIDGINYSSESDLSDHCGHGTQVALIARVRSIYEPRFLNVKVANAFGAGKPRDLIAGLRWLTNYQQSHQNQNIIANLSLGVFSKRWLALDCKGYCPVCEAAVEASKAGIFILAAAGNTPGKTACPAAAGLYRPDSQIVAVTLPGEQCGIGNFESVNRDVWVPIKKV